MKKNVIQHPFISRPSLEVGVPKLSAFAGGLGQMLEEESEEEALTVNRVRATRETVPLEEKLGVNVHRSTFTNRRARASNVGSR